MDNLSKTFDQMDNSIDKFNINDLVIGEKVYFINKNKLSSDGQIVNRYENCFAISIFIGQDNYTPVTINEKVHYLIVHKDQAFNCLSQVLGCKVEDGFQLAVLTIPQISNKIERRKQPRVPLVMSVDYFNLPEFTQYNFITQVPSVYFKKMKKTFTIDISSTGIKIVTYKESDAPKNAIISLFIEEKIDILASIIRVDFDNINNNYKTAFEFKDMDKYKWKMLNKFIDQKSKNL